MWKYKAWYSDWLPVGNPQKGGLPLKKKKKEEAPVTCVVDNYKVDIIHVNSCSLHFNSN